MPTIFLRVGFSLVFSTCGAGAGGVMYLAQGIFEGSTTQTKTDRSNKYFSFHFLSMSLFCSMFGPSLHWIIGDCIWLDKVSSTWFFLWRINILFNIQLSCLWPPSSSQKRGKTDDMKLVFGLFASAIIIQTIYLAQGIFWIYSTQTRKNISTFTTLIWKMDFNQEI